MIPRRVIPFGRYLVLQSVLSFSFHHTEKDAKSESAVCGDGVASKIQSFLSDASSSDMQLESMYVKYLCIRFFVFP
jgi:hypothetical protein